MSPNLQKLTVPQLKALCKEKGLNGYSKLAKAALVEKLTAVGAVAPPALPAASASTTQHEQPTKSGAKRKPPKVLQAVVPVPVPATPQVVAPTNSGLDQLLVAHPSTVREQTAVPNNGKRKSLNVTPPLRAPNEVPVLTSPQKHGPEILESPVQRPVVGTSIHAHSSLPPSRDTAGDYALPRPSPVSQPTRQRDANESLSKKQKLNHNQDLRTTAISKSSQAVAQLIQAKATVSRSTPVVIQPANREKNQAAKSNTHIPRGTAGAGKRYIPLVIKPKNIVMVQEIPMLESTSHHTGLVSSELASQHQHPKLHISSGIFTVPAPLDESTLSFKAITLPPPLSQRKFATKLAIILRDVRAEDMPSLTLTSRLIRYSAYLSAANHLKRWYAGERVVGVLSMKDVSVDRMSLWRYRRMREREVEERKRDLMGHSLDGSGRFFGRLVAGDVDVIEDGVWRRDDGRGLVVALRFLLTRCYFCVSLGRDLDEVRRDIIVDAQEVVKDEIWCIKAEKRDESKSLAKFYVLEATCEVIGGPVGLDRTLPTRGDWFEYIKKYVFRQGMEKVVRIMDHVRWTNHEEYDHGISKIWLRQAQGEGEIGELKRVVARRYILACTMANSLSGRYMTSNEMEQELSGLPDKTTVCQKTREMRINLFLPAHHHVESVHFTTSTKQPLHPAVAVVQTPTREYYILKENGMQIGCEEEGIPKVWIELIGCGSTGEVKAVGR